MFNSFFLTRFSAIKVKFPDSTILVKQLTAQTVNIGSNADYKPFNMVHFNPSISVSSSDITSPPLQLQRSLVN